MRHSRPRRAEYWPGIHREEGGRHGRDCPERSGDEFGERHGDLFGKVRELALRTRTHVKSPAPTSIGHAAAAIAAVGLGLAALTTGIVLYELNAADLARPAVAELQKRIADRLRLDPSTRPHSSPK
jgi:hypothetical protein